MRSVQVSKPKGSLEMVEKEIPEHSSHEVRIKVNPHVNITLVRFLALSVYLYIQLKKDGWMVKKERYDYSYPK